MARVKAALEAVVRERLGRIQSSSKAAMAALAAMLTPRGLQQRAPECQGIMLAAAGGAAFNPRRAHRADSLALEAVDEAAFLMTVVTITICDHLPMERRILGVELVAQRSETQETCLVDRESL